METSATTSRPSVALQLFGVLWPVLALFFASPVIAAGFSHLDETGVLLVAPSVVGALSAPGYLYALLGWRHVPGLPLRARVWVRISFAAALASSLAGTVMGMGVLLPGVASLLSAINVGLAWWRLEARTSNPRGMVAR